MKIRGFIILLGLGCSIGQTTAAFADEAQTVGVVLAVQGTVMMQPATMTAPMPLHQFAEIGPLSILESQAGSRCKILYADDSLLTLGDNSRLEVVEQSYEPGNDQRAFVAHLSRGSVRALVARQFEGGNSTYEIDAGTSAVTARGTYFVTWVNGKPPAGKRSAEEGMEMEGASGVANIGRTGNVAFTSGGATVLVLPGQFSIALPGAPPTMPSSIQTHIVPVASAISGTVLPDTPKKESPREALAAVGIGEAAAPAERLTAAPVVAKAGTLGGNAPSTAYVLPDWPFPITPVTPPAVTSGAAFGGNSTVNLNIRLP
ncbi:MAG TPA: FecR family protein [Nitrospira sp.]|nr:FecR family protein [Nitrospira sp.]